MKTAASTPTRGANAEQPTDAADSSVYEHGHADLDLNDSAGEHLDGHGPQQIGGGRAVVDVVWHRNGQTGRQHPLGCGGPVGASDVANAIGEELFLSRNTIKSYLRRLYQNLNASSREEAVLIADELGLLLDRPD